MTHELRRWALIRGLFLLTALLFFTFASNGQAQNVESPETSVEDVATGGPCYIDADGNMVCSVDGAQTGTQGSQNGEPAPAVDLAAQPWLVESANLPPESPALKRAHMIWADSYLWTSIDDVVGKIPVEKWLTKAPTPEDLKGKYVLVEMWATWCPPCRRSLPYLDFISKKYKDDLVVVSICEMDENAIRNMPGKGLNIFEIGYFAAVDTGRRLATKLGVYGIPHAILLEPTVGGVVWEGMPTLPRYELDDKKLERFFAIGKKLKDAGRMPDASPVVFEVSEPTQEERASRRRVNSTEVSEELGLPTVE